MIVVLGVFYVIFFKSLGEAARINVGFGRNKSRISSILMSVCGVKMYCCFVVSGELLY